MYKDNSVNRYALGVDIGGTFIRIGIVNREYNLFCYEQYSSGCLSCDSAVELIRLLGDYIKDNKEYTLSGIAVGIPGRVAGDGSYVFSVPRIPGLQNTDLGGILKKELGLPVYVDRDVNNLMTYDIKKNNLDPNKNKTVLGFYIGTGMGNGLWINGGIHRGCHGVSGELGHIPLYGVSDTCACGAVGCAETRCSGEYLEKIVKAHFSDCTIKDIFVKHGSDLRVMQFIKDCAIPIATEMIIMDPHIVIIGGGVAGMIGFPLKELEGEIFSKTRHSLPERDITIVCSENIKTAGIIGGCMKLFEEI